MSLANTIIYGDKDAVFSYLQSGADVNEVDEYGFRPLIEAAIVNKTDIAELLLHHGADVDQEDSTKRTALHWAVENNNLALCKLLLEHKANPDHYTSGSQPTLVNPILRRQVALKNLLYEYKSDLNFALDYINTKLLGHRYELTGQVDIVEPKGRFIELDFEGFFLEFTLSIILQSLERYRNNFAARNLRRYFKFVKILIESFDTAAKLIKFQQYLINIDEYSQKINSLLNYPLLIIPVAHRGHAITFVQYKDLLVKCDRGENSLKESSINIYRVRQKRNLNKELYKQLMYIRQQPEFILSGYKQLLDTTLVMRIPLASQITGNCSWSNVEAAIPTILFLLMAEETRKDKDSLRQCMDESLHFYRQWVVWDKDRALSDCLSSFEDASPARKASKAGVLGAVLFQCCRYNHPKDIERAEKILKILTLKPYRYVLESYIEVYYRRNKTLPGENLVQLLDMCGLAWY
jgi:hypothetical protein